MTDREYAVKSMKEITFQMASNANDYLETALRRHYDDMKELMTKYQKLILENQVVLEELEAECQEKINEDMAYALHYMDIYKKQLDVVKIC
jgi:glycerate-2-kinase